MVDYITLNHTFAPSHLRTLVFLPPSCSHVFDLSHFLTFAPSHFRLFPFSPLQVFLSSFSPVFMQSGCLVFTFIAPSHLRLFSPPLPDYITQSSIVCLSSRATSLSLKSMPILCKDRKSKIPYIRDLTPTLMSESTALFTANLKLFNLLARKTS